MEKNKKKLLTFLIRGTNKSVEKFAKKNNADVHDKTYDVK